MASVAKKISTKFKNRYRLIVRKDDNLEERISIVLTPMNSLLVISVLVVLFGTVIILLLSYTSMSNILPTTANNFSQKEKMELMQKIDSLETYQRQVQEQELALRAILMGDGEVPENIALQEREEQTSSSPPAANLFTPNPVNYTFYSPVKGVVTDTFNVERKHYAVDVVAKKGDIVKSAQQGTVIFSAWNPETGYTLVIQHANDFLSVYKHNSKLLKKEGNFVRAGDAVALVGSTGELTSGPHLHFELWNKGVALDPQKYISFK